MTEPKPLAVFDVDGTIFKSSLLEKVVQQCIDVGLFAAADFTDVWQMRRAWQLKNSEDVYLRYIQKLIDELVAHIKGVDVHVFDWVAHKMVEDNHVRLFAFPRQLMESVRESHTLVIISGSPEPALKPFVEQFGIDMVFGSQLEHIDGVYTGEATSMRDKAAVLQRLVSGGEVLQEGSVAIGDTVSDIPMLEFVDLPIMFNASRTLVEYGSQRGWARVNEVKDSVVALELERDQGEYREVEVEQLLGRIHEE
jgi:HAD superfamily phosphoserine phosphatase-like hydrolase